VPTYVALLRGINLGARNRVAMADLRALLEGLGYDDVRTHLQSGNAVFSTGTRSATAVRTAVEKAIDDELGVAVPVVVRTAAQVAKVVAADQPDVIISRALVANDDSSQTSSISRSRR